MGDAEQKPFGHQHNCQMRRSAAMTKVTYVPKPRYENSMAERLGLGADDLKRESKLARLLEDLQGKIRTPIQGVVEWRYAEAEDQPEAHSGSSCRLG